MVFEVGVQLVLSLVFLCDLCLQKVRVPTEYIVSCILLNVAPFLSRSSNLNQRVHNCWMLHPTFFGGEGGVSL
ncbi:hypothetical protein B296_00059094 [Ensete ventricosum]|uniref:Secreted protein n=1 Tax=Ensete ventricosum TaxID=4639 RepID=A0A426XAL5_ENSVE|nr:hypothetical protein B296_00059094 [Ensete ventricosum]